MTSFLLLTIATAISLSISASALDGANDIGLFTPTYGSMSQTILGGWPDADIYDLDIVNADISPDGFTRQAVLAGGTFPGPVIKGWKGDNFRIHVHDRLTNSSMNKTTTIHWHGIFQHRTNWADGVSMVTQCPIASNQSFLYNFNVRDQAGTYWYHSHEGLQYCDGLRGPLVIYDPEDPHADLYDIDDESTIITLADWYHLPARQVPIPAQPQSVLINGLGRQANDTTSPLAVIRVFSGLRYRFRLISISCDPNFTFSIDDHNVTIIEADAQDTEPLPEIDSIQIWAAQRYSFILEANQPIDNYWIHATPEVGFTASPGLAILHYAGAPHELPKANSSVIPTPRNPLVETNLHPLTNPAAPPFNPEDGDVDIVLNVIFNFTTGLFEVNNASYIPPPVPVLLQILNGTYAPHQLLPEGSVYGLPPNKTVQITIPGGVLNITHPLHLHGHAFSVVRSAGNSSYNYVNPVRRDTVNIGLQGDEVTFRFRTDNSGPWILHCHIDFHLNAGFAVVMAENPNGTAAANVPSVAWDNLCPIFDDLPVSDL